MFRDFVFGRIPVNMDTNTIYSVTKFYFNNLLNGTVPLWDPFVLLGTPFYAITICNLFNPVTQLVLVLKLLGANYYDAFMAYVVVYYFLGGLGFYCLAKTLFEDRRAAYMAYLLFLFSGIGASIFNQMTILELFVPAVWFFVFLLRFARHYRKSDFLGLSYSAMILMISYLPFYFATLLMCFLFFGVILFFKKWKAFGKGLVLFARRNVGLVVICILGWLVSCAPLAVYKMIDASQNVVSPARHCNYSEMVDCYERTLNEEGGMSYKETSQSGGLAERVDGRGLFTHLDKVSYGVDQFFYIPIVVYIFILLSAFVAFDRTMALLAGLATILALIGMADVTPVHRFFYDHIFFFKYFRNLFFFEAYVIPVIILFSVGQLKRLWSVRLNNFSQKKAMIVWTALAHGAFFLFLVRQDGMIITSLFSVAGSFVLFTALYTGFLKNGSVILFAGIAVVLLLQPFEVFYHYGVNAREFQCVLPKDHVRPQFAWTRPTEEIKSDCKIFKFVPYETFYNSMAMKDSRGVIGYPASVTRGAFLLSQWVDEDTLVRFAQHKIFLYDNVRSFSERPLEIRTLEAIFNDGRNVAYVENANGGLPASFTPEDWGQSPSPEVLTGPSDRVQVKRFDVNHLKMMVDVPARKFLVYTDSFTKHWKVFVNGRPEKLMRVDGAFKGVWLPAGKSEVEFRYSPPGGGAVYLIVTVVLFIFMGMLVFYLRKEKDWPWRVQAA